MLAYNQTTNNQPTDRASNYIITNRGILSRKTPKMGLFSAEPCLNLSYYIKFNSGDVLPEQKPFWASLYYILINIYSRESQAFRSFHNFLGFLGVCN